MGLDTTHDCWHGAYSGFARPGQSNQSRLATFIAGLQRAVDEWEIVRFH